MNLDVDRAVERVREIYRDNGGVVSGGDDFYGRCLFTALAEQLGEADCPHCERCEFCGTINDAHHSAECVDRREKMRPEKCECPHCGGAVGERLNVGAGKKEWSCACGATRADEQCTECGRLLGRDETCECQEKPTPTPEAEDRFQWVVWCRGENGHNYFANQISYPLVIGPCDRILALQFLSIPERWRGKGVIFWQTEQMYEAVSMGVPLRYPSNSLYVPGSDPRGDDMLIDCTDLDTPKLVATLRELGEMAERGE